MKCVIWVALLAALTISCRDSSRPQASRSFQVRGVLQEIKAGGKTAVIKHEEIPGYMAAMTMPFNVRDTNEITSLKLGDQISFRLRVTDDESWIEQIIKTTVATPVASSSAPLTDSAQSTSTHPLMHYAFTNQLGQPVTLASFRGQALAMTFFFTRCPIPEYCPRLSKNFEEASQKLLKMPDGRTNWHFLSVTIDPQFDTPTILRDYARRYQHDPQHWSFLTGPPDKIAELARQSDVTYEPGQGILNHNFRTLIINPAGQLQMSFPIGGDISDAIVDEIIKALRIGSG